MELLNLGGSDESAAPKRSLGRFKKMGLGLALVAVAATVSTTLAGAININGGSNGNGSVTFGQGVATTASCDDNINVSPTSEYTNSYGFLLKDITVSDISIGCLNKRLALNLYAQNGDRLNLDPILVDFRYNGDFDANLFTEPFVYDCHTYSGNTSNGYPDCWNDWGQTYNPTIIGINEGASDSGGTNNVDSTQGTNSFTLHYIGNDCNLGTYNDNWCNVWSADVVRMTIESTDIPAGAEEYTSCLWNYCATGHTAAARNAKRNMAKPRV